MFNGFLIRKCVGLYFGTNQSDPNDEVAVYMRLTLQGSTVSITTVNKQYVGYFIYLSLGRQHY